MTIYGTVGRGGGFPCYMDANKLAFTGRLVSLKSKSDVNLIMIGGQNQANGGLGVSFVDVISSTFSVGDLYFKEHSAMKGTAANDSDQNTVFNISSSSDCKYNVKTSSHVPNSGSAVKQNVISMKNCMNVRLMLDVESANLWFLVIQGLSSKNNYVGGIVRIPNTNIANGDGIITFADGGGGSVIPTSAPVRIDVDFYLTGEGSANAIRVINFPGTGASPTVNNAIITGSVTCTSITNTVVGVYIGSNVTGTTVSNFVNHSCQTTVTDTGISSSLEYIKDGVKTGS